MAKRLLLPALLSTGILLASIGMHQTIMARRVSKLVFEAAHTHNWFWADGWAELFIEESRRSGAQPDKRDVDRLVRSFEASRRMTDCFSSLRRAGQGYPEQEIIADLVEVFDVSPRQATQVVWITTTYSPLFPEFESMMDNTDNGSRYSQEVIDLIRRGGWDQAADDFRRVYDKMRLEEHRYSESSFYIAERADRLSLTFLLALFVFIGLFFLHVVRRRHVNAQNRLKKVQNYITNIIDSMPSILIGVDASGRVTQWNDKARISTGIPAPAATGRMLDEVFPQMASEMTRIQDSIRNQQLISDTRKARRTDSGTCYEDVTIYPLVADGIAGAVIRIDDVTKEHNLEEQLSQTRKMESIGQLAGGVAHDFNNMLSGIVSCAELIKTDANLSSESKHYVDLILKASARAADLTAKLLAFGRKGRAISAVVSAGTLVSDVVSLLERTIDKRITLKTDIATDDLTLVGDKSQLQNALINIGINASHAMPDGGDLSFRVTRVQLDTAYCEASPFQLRSGAFVCIEIRDTGCGISKDDINKIFEPFFTTKEQGEGTGLGLAAVYGTVQDHHGAVTVHSEVGMGTTLRLYLPLSGEDETRDQEEQEVITGSGRILLVDDEELVRASAQTMIEGLGYEVLLAENGEEAIRVFRENQSDIDLVVLDMIMPVMNGRDTFAELRRIDGNCKVIIASGFSKTEDLEELALQGLSGFIRKPFRQSEMSWLLADALKRVARSN